MSVGHDVDSGSLLLADDRAGELVLGPGEVLFGGLIALERVKRLPDDERLTLVRRFRIRADDRSDYRHVLQRLLFGQLKNLSRSRKRRGRPIHSSSNAINRSRPSGIRTCRLSFAGPVVAADSRG